MGIRVIEFRTDYRPSKEPLEWVHYTGSDSYSENGQLSSSTWERVKKLQPPEQIENDPDGLKMAALRYIWGQIEPHYLAWKEGNELPESGTALAAWGGVNASQITALKGIGIKTVEDLAAISDSNVKAVLPNMRELRTLARQWLEGRPQAERDAEIEQLKAQNAAMLEMLAEMKAARAEEDPAQDKPRRGRPPKVSEAA